MRRRSVFWILILVCLAIMTPGSAPILRATGQEQSQHQSQAGILNSRSAQNGNLIFPAEIEFRHLDSADGLSQDGVLSMLQDSHGYLWVGTRAGLNRFDGYEFRKYLADRNDADALSDNSITALEEDQSGFIWVGTSNGGLNRLDRLTDTFRHFRHEEGNSDSLTSNFILALILDRHGFLWVGTAGGGLDRVNTETFAISHYRNNPQDDTSLSSNHVQALFVDHEGTLWIGTIGGGICHLDTSVNDPEIACIRSIPGDPYSLSSNEVYSIIEDGDGSVWIGTTEGVLNRYDREQNLFFHYHVLTVDEFAPLQPAIRAIQVAPQGGLWLGMAHEGLIYFNHHTGLQSVYIHQALNRSSLSNDQIRAIMIDRQGLLWVGTDGGGLNSAVMTQNNFAHIHQDSLNQNSLTDNEVYSILETSNGDLWIGTFGGGINRFSPDGGRKDVFINNSNDPTSLSSNMIYSLSEDSDGNIWVGTVGGGLNCYNIQSEQFYQYQHDPTDPESISDDTIGVVYAGFPGEIWAGTFGNGLNRLDIATGKIIHYKYDSQNSNSLANDTIRAIYGIQDGSIWIGTDNGLSRFDRITEDFDNYRFDPADQSSLSNNSILSIYQDLQGIIWIGTNGGGLNQIDPQTGKIVRVSGLAELENQVIYGILADRSGQLWLSTSNNLLRYDPLNGLVRDYDMEDGLPASGFNMNAAYASRTGRLYFGSVRGVVSFDPSQLFDDPFLPPIQITALTYQGEPLLPGAELIQPQVITLRWPQNDFEFEYAALSFRQPADNQYAYWLEGFDPGWNEAGTRRYGRYMNLPAGDYVLHLKGSNQDGVWNEDVEAMNITVVPALWQRVWFQILLGLIGLTLVWGVNRLRMYNIQATNRALEEQVRQRTAEIEQRRQVAEGLQQIILLLNSEKSLVEGLSLILARAQTLQQADHGYIVHYPLDKPPRILVAGTDSEKLQEDDFAILCESAKIVHTDRPYLISDLGQLIKTNGETEYQTLLSVPIRVEGEIFGGLILLFVEEKSFSEDDCELALLFADQAGLAIGNSRLRERAQQSAVVSERNRLARDLHDAVTQTLFSASLIAEALPGLWDIDPDEGRQLLQSLRQLSRGALAEMRSLLLELRPAALMESGLSELVGQLAEAAGGQAGLIVHLNLDPAVQLPADLHEGYYRIAQESLNNVVKHARATEIWVKLEQTHTDSNGQKVQVVLSVKDNGCGIRENRLNDNHFGIKIMQERAQNMHAQLDILGEPGCGTEIRLSREVE